MRKTISNDPQFRKTPMNQPNSLLDGFLKLMKTSTLSEIHQQMFLLAFHAPKFDDAAIHGLED